MTNETTNVTVNKGKKAKMRTKELTFISLMGALSAVLLVYNFPLPFMPPFMEFDFAGIVEIIGGLMFGPIASVYIIALKILLKLVTVGTTSGFTGEIQNFILSCTFVLPPTILYARNKTKKTAIIGMVIGIIITTIAAIFTNLYMIIPFFIAISTDMTMETIIAMCAEANPFIKDTPTFVALGIIPFNLIKYGASSAFTVALYKRLSRPIKRFINE